MKNRPFIAGVLHVKQFTIALAALTVSAGLAAPAKADPPVAPPQKPFLPLFCFRFTDVKQVGRPADNNFQFEFEVLNWTNAKANKLTVNFLSQGSTTSTGSSLNTGVNVTTAFVDQDGRFLTPRPAIPPPGNVAPTNNNWSSTFNSIPSGPFGVKQAIYDAGALIPNIDILSILNGSTTAQEAISKVNALPSWSGKGYFPNHDFSPISNPETIDNGTNVLDGFVFEAHSFDPGDYLVFGWQLGAPAPDDISINPGANGIGILARRNLFRANFNNPVNGFPGTGPTVSNITLFAPGSSPVGSQYGFSAGLGAGVGIGDIRDVTPVPGPVPAFGAAMALGYARMLKKRCSRLQDHKAAPASS